MIINIKKAMNEEKIFRETLKKNGMRVTGTRLVVLKAFLKVEEHVTVERLYDRVKKRHPQIGYATVHRTLKLLARHGLAREIEFGDRISHFEHTYEHDHHDHLVCQQCGKTIEFVCPEIEEFQAKVVRHHRFQPIRHKLQIFGYCEECRGKTQKEKGHAGQTG